MKIAYTATEAREKFFEILNAVYYRDEVVLITKNKKIVAEISKPVTQTAQKSVFDYIGTLSMQDADTIKMVANSLKKLPARSSHE